MHEIKVPRAGQSVEEVEIVQWLKQEGDTVSEGEPLLTIQTDKAEIEVESTASGTLRKILVAEGAEVPVLAVIALVGEADEALPDSLPASPAAPQAAAPTPQAEAAAPAPTHAAAPAQTSDRVSASPRARAMARDQHINAASLSGTGPGGRVIARDVEGYVGKLDAAAMTPVARRIAADAGIDPATVQGSGPRGKITKDDVKSLAKTSDGTAAAAPPAAGSVRRTPLSKMRKVIAQRMAASKFEAPHYYVTIEVDMAAVVAFRKSLTRFKASYNDFVLLACRDALLAFPQVNARWAGDAIEEVGDINLGMAVALPTGLIVPVIRNAQDLSLEGLANTTKALAEKAKTGKLTPDDYQGNTFTVSNLGVFGVDHFTAIINQPDSAILAVGQMKDQVVAIDGGIHIRPMMKLTLSSDHRVIDGAVAAQFMGQVKAILEAGAFH